MRHVHVCRGLPRPLYLHYLIPFYSGCMARALASHSYYCRHSKHLDTFVKHAGWRLRFAECRRSVAHCMRQPERFSPSVAGAAYRLAHLVANEQKQVKWLRLGQDYLPRFIAGIQMSPIRRRTFHNLHEKSTL